jgi:hypothetical protein
MAAFVVEVDKEALEVRTEHSNVFKPATHKRTKNV